jgi:hypothetical protein
MASTAERMLKRRRKRGAVMVEYAMLLTMVGIPAVVGIYAGGKAMVSAYGAVRNNILQTVP